MEAEASEVTVAPSVARALKLAAKPSLDDAELLDINCGLLDAIATHDVDSYKALCAPQLTCFEPEARGHMVTGLSFHEYYFHYFAAQPKPEGEVAPSTTVLQPHVRWLGDKNAALVCFKRLVQRGTTTIATEETRVWEFMREPEEEAVPGWRLVHFHRSAGG